MPKYLFQRVDIHYVEVEADSEEQAEEEVRQMSCMDARVENHQGSWEIERADE
jgi:hypothetical protein